MAKHPFFVPNLPRLGRRARPSPRLALWLLDIDRRAAAMRITDEAVIAFAKARVARGGKRSECYAILDGNARQFDKPAQVRRYLRARGWGGGELADLTVKFFAPVFPDWRRRATVFAPEALPGETRARLSATLAGTNAALYDPAQFVFQPDRPALTQPAAVAIEGAA